MASVDIYQMTTKDTNHKVAPVTIFDAVVNPQNAKTLDQEFEDMVGAVDESVAVDDADATLVTTALRKSAQVLTLAEQQQARTNINAADADVVADLSTTVSENKEEVDGKLTELSTEDERLSFNQTFSLDKIMPAISMGEEPVTYEIIDNKFYNANLRVFSDNANYDCWKAEVSNLRGSFLHAITTIFGSLAAIVFLDENEEYISHHFLNSEGVSGRDISLYVIVPKEAAYVVVNNNKNNPSKNPGIWAVTRTLQYEKDVYPTFISAIDAISLDGKMLVVPNAAALVSSGNPSHGEINWNTIDWHMGIYKLRSNEPIQLLGATSSIFMFYRDYNFSNESLIEHNSSGVVPEGAKYCCIDFDSSISIDVLRTVRVNQTNTFSCHEKALLKTKQVLIERDYSKDTELFNHELRLDGSIIESGYTYGVSIFYIDDVNKYTKIIFNGVLYGSNADASFAYYDKNDVFISSERKHSTEFVINNSLELNVPENTAKIAVLYYVKVRIPTLYGFLKDEYISSDSIEKDLLKLKENSLKTSDIVVLPFSAANKGLWYVGGYSDNAYFFYNEYLVSELELTEGELLLFKAGIGQNTRISFIVFLDAENNPIGAQHWFEQPKVVDCDLEVVVPEQAYKIVVNSASNYTITLIKRSYVSYKEDIDTISRALTKMSEKKPLTPSETKEGYFILPDGTERANVNFKIETFDVSSIDFEELYVTSGIGSATTLNFVAYYQGDRFLGNDLYYNSPTDIFSEKTIPPTGTDTVKLSSPLYRTTLLEYAYKEGYYSSEELYNKIEEVERNLGINDKLMKVVINSTEPNNGNRLFYIRTRYNDAKDIILEYYINNNTLISPKAAYLGSKDLEDSDIMTTSNRMTNHSDSTAPLFNSSVYWHLFAQHGYLIPRLNNTVGMTSADVGAVWKDQLDREYTIGDVTDSIISLLPTIYKDANGNDTRGWKTPNSTAISTLTHVSGGSYTTTFETSNASTNQLRPIMNHSNRVFLIDGKEITEGGTYYCDEFKVSESQVGYDPASITTWFPTPVLDNANEMARFTWSYNFKGAQCCVNTTIDIRTRVECQSYGATQQQTFFDNGNYKAMFMIPKAASRNGVELDKPFNSASASAPGYSFYRTSEYLKDVDDPIDRLIGFLHNPTDNTYLFGMAAGLSLVSGDTIREKRIASMPIGDKDGHYRVGSISPSNINKFYIAAINTAPYEADNYHFPTTLFKEINYYVSYFDPSENVGQVYWYKDGSKYVIYMHCQTEQNKLAINLPDFMEGLKIEIVEKTEGSTLLTDVIQNGKLYVNYNGDANHIVIKTV